MAGLREKMKRRRRQSVLTAAETLFREHGYAQTSIERIAETAEVSVGTLYAYFGSKSGILSELFQPLIGEGRAKGVAVLEDPPRRASSAVIALFEAYRFGEHWQGLNLLQAFGIRNPERDTRLDAVRDAYETLIKQQLTVLLNQFTAARRFNPTIDVGEVAEILYLVFIDTFETYVASGGARSYPSLLDRLHRRVEIMFLEWEPV